MVRGLGPRVPLHPARAGRPGVRQGAADPVAARVVHAPERPAARLRVGVRRREPAGARVGGVARLQDRAEASAAWPIAQFLERVFHKLLLNFTWWVNRKDAEGNNVFQGGFLGLDNIGVFDRSAPLPTGGHLEQSDGTELDGDVLPEHAGDRAGAGAREPGLRGRGQQVLRALPLHRPRDERPGRATASALWDEEDGFFYDVLHLPDGGTHAAEGPLDGRAHPAVRGRDAGAASCSTGCPASSAACSGSSTTGRTSAATWRACESPGRGERRLLSHRATREQLRRVLRYMLDETEFLSPLRHPRAVARSSRPARTCCRVDGIEYRVDYEPAESTHRAVRRQLELARARSGSRSTTC